MLLSLLQIKRMFPNKKSKKMKKKTQKRHNTRENYLIYKDLNPKILK